RVTDRAGGILVIHRVAALAVGIGGLHYDVAAEVRHLAPIVAGAEVLVLQPLVQRDRLALDRLDAAFLGLRVVAGAGAERLLHLFRRGLRGPNAQIPAAPARPLLGQRELRVAGLCRLAEFDPGAAEGSAVEVHSAAAADDGRARLLVQTRHVMQAD